MKLIAELKEPRKHGKTDKVNLHIIKMKDIIRIKVGIANLYFLMLDKKKIRKYDIMVNELASTSNSR